MASGKCTNEATKRAMEYHLKAAGLAIGVLREAVDRYDKANEMWRYGDDHPSVEMVYNLGAEIEEASETVKFHNEGFICSRED